MKFATEILGLQLVRRDADRAYLRASAGQDHHVVYERGDLRREALAFAADTDPSLQRVLGDLEKAGYRVNEGSRAEAEDRHVTQLYSVIDPSGNRLELVRGIEAASTITYSRDAGITAFSHVGLRTTNAPRDERFWTHGLGARVSDWIGDAPLLRLDAVHHRVALFPSARQGFQHVNFQVTGIDDIMRSYYFLKSRNVKITFGPGRHPTSGAMFLYFQGPDDMIYEYSSGVRMITDEKAYEPRRFPFATDSFCMWGAIPDIPEFKVTK